MKIAYVTTYDSSNVHAWSGTGSYILQTLRDSGFNTETVGNLYEPTSYVIKGKSLLYRTLHKNYLPDREPIILRSYATQVGKALVQLEHDSVFSPGTIPIAYLRNEKPVAFWTDCTFAGMIDFFPHFSNLCAESIKNGNKMEQRALSRCHLAIYSSEWAAESAVRNYDVDPAKVHVVPFGANVHSDRSMRDIEEFLEKKSTDICRLLFLGVDWHRKGGDVALAVAELLNQRGIRTELEIVGCDPPRGLPAFARCHGFISKKTEEGRNRLSELMAGSHFLILPSRAECYGIVFAEASSFGLPSLATRVGGIPTAIHDGENGQTFPIDEGPVKYCDYIETVLSSQQGYRALARSSFNEYSTRLNWSSAGKRVRDLILEFCA